MPVVVPLPRTARQKKSAHSARENFPFRRWGKAAGRGGPAARGKGSGYMMGRSYGQPAPPGAPRPGRVSGGRECAPGGAVAVRSGLSRRLAGADREVSGNELRVTRRGNRSAAWLVSAVSPRRRPRGPRVRHWRPGTWRSPRSGRWSGRWSRSAATAAGGAAGRRTGISLSSSLAMAHRRRGSAPRGPPRDHGDSADRETRASALRPTGGASSIGPPTR